MPDIKIVKTDNIDKVKHEKNQLIFVKDSSFYFDYNNELRLRNVGSGSTLNDFQENTRYEKNDFIVHDQKFWRYKQEAPAVLTEFRECDWEYLGVCGDPSGYVVSADEVTYDGTDVGLDATNVQDAISLIWLFINNSDNYNAVIGSF